MFKNLFKIQLPKKFPYWYIFLGLAGVMIVKLAITPGMEVYGCGIALILLFTAHVFKIMAEIYKDIMKTWKTISEQMKLCTNELFDGPKLLVAPGDVADKLSILDIKYEKINDPEKILLITEERHRTKNLLNNILNHYSRMKPKENIKYKFKKYYQELLEINRQQWIFEDRIRMEQSWEAAVAARMNNSKRVIKKNEINKWLDYPTETKEYAEKER